MRCKLKLAARFLLFAGLCVCLTSEELWLKNALASNTGRIVFTFLRDGNLEIYVMDADGGNQERLTNHPAYDDQADWSPDGRKIAFVSGRDVGPSQIYVMDADGKNPIRLTDGPGQKHDPDWSPDGGKIAFTVDELAPIEDHIDVMDADGRNRKKLEDQAKYPSWSPDGQQIAFVSRRDGGNEIYVIGIGGQGRRRVTQDLVGKLSPSFSPDGRIIAYYVSDGIWPDLRGTIHLMTADGKYLRQLSDDRGARDFEPDISPLGLAVSPTSKTTTTWGRVKKLAPNPRKASRLTYELRIFIIVAVQRRSPLRACLNSDGKAISSYRSRSWFL